VTIEQIWSETLIHELDNSEVHFHLRQRDIRWKFNPPQASHMGGMWERQICSIQCIFNAFLSSQILTDDLLATFQTLTDDLLATLMAEPESIIISRPLTPYFLIRMLERLWPPIICS